MAEKMTKVQIVEHSLDVHETEVANYDAQKIVADIAKAQLEMPHVVAIGDVLIDARSVKSVKKIV